MGIEGNFLAAIAEPVFEIYGEFYPELTQKKEMILSVLAEEEKGSIRLWKKALKNLKRYLKRAIFPAKTLLSFFHLRFPFGDDFRIGKRKKYKC